jgi:hypothetical protein
VSSIQICNNNNTKLTHNSSLDHLNNPRSSKNHLNLSPPSYPACTSLGHSVPRTPILDIWLHIHLSWPSIFSYIALGVQLSLSYRPTYTSLGHRAANTFLYRPNLQIPRLVIKVPHTPISVIVSHKHLYRLS